MTVYGEFLRQVVESEAGWVDRPLGELVALVLTRRAAVVGDVAGRAPSRLGAALSYDAALVLLCDRLGVQHDLLGQNAGPTARRTAEEQLATRLPALASALAGGPPGI